MIVKPGTPTDRTLRTLLANAIPIGSSKRPEVYSEENIPESALYKERFIKRLNLEPWQIPMGLMGNGEPLIWDTTKQKCGIFSRKYDKVFDHEFLEAIDPLKYYLSDNKNNWEYVSLPSIEYSSIMHMHLVLNEDFDSLPENKRLKNIADLDARKIEIKQEYKKLCKDLNSFESRLEDLIKNADNYHRIMIDLSTLEKLSKAYNSFEKEIRGNSYDIKPVNELDKIVERVMNLMRDAEVLENVNVIMPYHTIEAIIDTSAMDDYFATTFVSKNEELEDLVADYSERQRIANSHKATPARAVALINGEYFVYQSYIDRIPNAA